MNPPDTSNPLLCPTYAGNDWQGNTRTNYCPGWSANLQIYMTNGNTNSDQLRERGHVLGRDHGPERADRDRAPGGDVGCAAGRRPRRERAAHAALRRSTREHQHRRLHDQVVARGAPVGGAGVGRFVPILTLCGQLVRSRAIREDSAVGGTTECRAGSLVRGRRANRGESGVALVEMAIVVPLLLLLVFGILDFGVFLYRNIELTQGVREAGRQGAVALVRRRERRVQRRARRDPEPRLPDEAAQRRARHGGLRARAEQHRRQAVRRVRDLQDRARSPGSIQPFLPKYMHTETIMRLEQAPDPG